jgi:acetate---CoA ligase (ADP-forming)
MHIDTLFNPRSVAVVGADNDPSKVGYALMKNALTSGVREIYPVTISEPSVLDHVAYTSVNAIPGDVDLAIIAVRADVVPTILKQSAEKGIKTAVVISAGFKEMGVEGKRLEDEMVEVAKEHGITLLGPNCLGVMNTHAEWNGSFAVKGPRKGSIGFVSQSGALGTALLDWADREGVGFSKFVSLGNEAMLTETEFLEYLRDDAETTAVLLYLEQVRDGKRFLELAGEVARKKPLIVLRAGRSARGSAAVASHTGSLAPADAVFEAALRQVGAIPVDSLRTLFSITKLLQLGVTAPHQSIAIVTNGGGPSVNTADLIETSHSLSLATFTEETAEALRAVLPPMAAVGNPIDVIGDAGPDRYDSVLSILEKVDDIDAIIALVTPQMMTDPAGIAQTLLTHRSSKQVLPVFMGGDAVAPGVAVLAEAGVVNFDSPSDVVEAMDTMAHRKQKIDAAAPEQGVHDTSSPTLYPFDEMRTLLDDYGVHLEGIFVQKKEDLASAAKKNGDGPYAIKALGPKLVHKTDLQAVTVNVEDIASLEKVWDTMTANIERHLPEATIEGMLVQNMTQGVECIIGMKRDPVFGPVIVFGLGGIFVEILKDAAMRIAPVSEEEALTQIKEIQGLPLLIGARGSEPVDMPALARIISAVAHLALDYPEIAEIDLNPVFATPSGARVVDARMMRIDA